MHVDLIIFVYHRRRKGARGETCASIVEVGDISPIFKTVAFFIGYFIRLDQKINCKVNICTYHLFMTFIFFCETALTMYRKSRLKASEKQNFPTGACPGPSYRWVVPAPIISWFQHPWCICVDMDMQMCVCVCVICIDVDA